MIRYSLLLGLLVWSVSGYCQRAASWDSSSLAKQLFNNVSYLSDDRLEGRGTGTQGEKKAYQFIIKSFQNAGLKPAGINGWLQPFEVTASVALRKFSFSVNDKLLAASAASFTGEGEIRNLPLVNCGYAFLHENQTDWAQLHLNGKVAIINAAMPEPNNPHSALNGRNDLESRAKKAQLEGAAAVVFYATDTLTALPSTKLRKSSGIGIPVFVVTAIQSTAPAGNISGRIVLKKEVRTAHNVIGFVDRGAPTTVVIGAHYDHLGYGETGGSLHANHEHEKAIHNGADDNASGTAGLMALAHRVANLPNLKQNYLFIAFSGEEMGLLGSNYFTKFPTIDLKQVAYMFNMDMIGRLKSAEPILGLNGVGTSPVWMQVADTTGRWGVKVKTSASGTGASDHTSFYLKDIPVIHFFSGTHSDYHKPSDDIEKINIGGMVMIMNYMDDMIQKLDSKGKLPFLKTKDEDNTPRQLKVTLGIMPDYLYDKEGVKVDGVSPGKPGDKAGMKAGDVILKLGDYTINDMQGYMKALGLFKKGETVPCEVLRGGQKMLLNVSF